MNGSFYSPLATSMPNAKRPHRKEESTEPLTVCAFWCKVGSVTGGFRTVSVAGWRTAIIPCRYPVNLVTHRGPLWSLFEALLVVKSRVSPCCSRRLSNIISSCLETALTIPSTRMQSQGCGCKQSTYSLDFLLTMCEKKALFCSNNEIIIPSVCAAKLDSSLPASGFLRVAGRRRDGGATGAREGNRVRKHA